MKIEYPKWLYPKSGEAVLVASKEERLALNGEYRESPADWPAGDEPLLEKTEEAPKRTRGTRQKKG